MYNIFELKDLFINVTFTKAKGGENVEDKKTLKVSLVTVICIFIIFLLIIIIGGMYFYYNFVLDTDEASNNVQNDTNVNTAIENNTEINDNTVDLEAIYAKYKDLYWLFDENSTEIEFANNKIVIENGIAYLQKNNTKTKIDSINGKVKYITAWGEQTLERVYALTEDGKVWVSICSDSGEKSDGLNDIFKNVNIQGTVINITNGNSALRITEPPYFLLSTGELINEKGSNYDELDGNFIKSFGNAYSQIYVGYDNTISYYNDNTKTYTKIKDEHGNLVKIKDAFVQWSSVYSNIVDETGGDERLIILTEDNKLLYFDGYENITAKNYTAANNKTVKSVTEETQNIQYGGHIKNIRVIFTDGTDLLIKDANRNFFGE